MGHNLDKTRRLDGWSIADIRSLVKYSERGLPVTRSAELRKPNPSVEAIVAMTETAIDHGYLDKDGIPPRHFDLTEAGQDLVRSRLTPRLRFAKAQAILQRFLDRVAEINADETSLIEVRSVWLFGSLLQEIDSVGDIDIAVDAAVRDSYRQLLNHDGRSEFIHLAQSRYGIPQHVLLDYQYRASLSGLVVRRALFGEQRHPYLHVTDPHELEILACPVRQIYDQAKGIQLSSPTLSAIPGTIAGPARPSTSIDLSDAKPTLIPVHAHWSSEMLRLSHFGWSERARLFVTMARVENSVADDDYRRRFTATTHIGRFRIHREFAETNAVYQVSIEQVSGKRTGLNIEPITTLVSWLAAIDLDRALRRTSALPCLQIRTEDRGAPNDRLLEEAIADHRQVMNNSEQPVH